MSGRGLAEVMDYTHYPKVENVCLLTDKAMLIFLLSKCHSNETQTTNSQNHRTAQVGRDIPDHQVLIPLLFLHSETVANVWI